MGLGHADLHQLPPPLHPSSPPAPRAKGNPGTGFFPSPGYGVPAGWRDGDRSYNSQLFPKGRSGRWAGRGFLPPGERAWGCSTRSRNQDLKDPPKKG